jgi:hypothetical protein
VHQALRREWLARLDALRHRHDELNAGGGLFSVTRGHTSLLSREAMSIEVEAWFGAWLLFEVEAFVAEEFGSRAEAISLLDDCAATALAAAESALSRRAELKVRPDWQPPLREALREVHRRTVAGLRVPPAPVPVPAYRWRLPAEAHLAAWDALRRHCLAGDDDRGVSVAGWDTGRVVAVLREHGLHRVLVLHQLFASNSCDTDVALLGGRRFDWIDLCGTYLTGDPFDWFIHFEDDGGCRAAGWPARSIGDAGAPGQ